MKATIHKLSFRACQATSDLRLFYFCILCTLVAILIIPKALGECTFSSGSTGANGEFNPPYSWGTNIDYSETNNVITVANKSDGIFNFTSVTISNIWTVKFTKNKLNTPVYLLTQSNVVINGIIDVNGEGNNSTQGGAGGPGGYDGGKADSPPGDGFGPGFGAPCGPDKGGSFGRSIGPCSPDVGSGHAYGTIDILPFIGGSGGAGNGSTSGDGGGGGGGAILIASSTMITVNGTITANGARCGSFSGGGSGGAIKLIASTLQGEGIIQAVPGINDASSTVGRIRLEACENRRLSLTSPVATFGPPGSVFFATNPTIFVTSIAGVNAPTTPGGSLSTPDVFLPTNFTNPAIISVSASNINTGTVFKVILIPSHGTNAMATNILIGSYAFSSNSVTMDVYPDRPWRVNALIDYIPRP